VGLVLGTTYNASFQGIINLAELLFLIYARFVNSINLKRLRNETHDMIININLFES